MFKKKINKTLNYEKITDNNQVEILTSEVLEDTKNVTTEIMNDYESYSQIAVFWGNFINSGDSEFVISYHKVTSMELCISYLVIVNSYGKILKEVSPLLNIGWHFVCLGISDYNSDGKNELIVDEGYYEGGKFLLVEFNGEFFEVISEGFDDGL